MTLDEWISCLDNEEADRLMQEEQLELKHLLLELSWYRLAFGNKMRGGTDGRCELYNKRSRIER